MKNNTCNTQIVYIFLIIISIKGQLQFRFQDFNEVLFFSVGKLHDLIEHMMWIDSDEKNGLNFDKEAVLYKRSILFAVSGKRIVAPLFL